MVLEKENRYVIGNCKIIIVTFFLLVSLLTVDGVCRNYLGDIDVFFSGEVAVSRNNWIYSVGNCSSVCSSYQTVGIEYKAAVTVNGLCFCTKLVKTSVLSTLTTCINSFCNYKICNISDFNVTDVAKLPNLTTEEYFDVGVPAQITVAGLQGSASIEYDFGDGYTYVTDQVTVEHTYLTPGFFFLKVGVEKSGSKRIDMNKWNVVLSQKAILNNTAFIVPQVLETNVEMTNCYLRIGEGSDVKLNVIQRYTKADGVLLNDIGPDYVFADVSVLVIGVPILDNAPATTQSSTDKLVVVPSLTFTETGSISSFEFFATKIGIFTIYIIRPICQCCVACNDKLSLMGNGTQSSVERISDTLKFNVTKVIMVDVTETGLQLHHLRTTDVEVIPGDMVSFIISAASSSIELKFVEQGNMYNKIAVVSSSLMEGEIVGPFLQKENKLPYLRVYLSKVYTYQLNSPGLKEIGNITFIAENFTSGTIIAQKTVPIQARINKVIFENLNTSYKSEETNIEINVIVNRTRTKRPDVSYKFDISKISENRNSSNGTANFYRAYWTPGIYEVDVIAYNLINSFEGKAVFSILDDIDKLEIVPPVVSIAYRRNFDLEVLVFNGTNVTLEVNFDDGSVAQSKFIPTAMDNSRQLFKHMYTVCGIYEIKVTAINSVTTALKQVLNVDAICPISDIQATAIPKANSENQVKLSIKDQLEIRVNLGTGSYAMYNISWGDGLFNVVNNTDKLKPEMVTVKHTYNIKDDSKMNFNVSVTVWNFINRETSNSIFVQMQNCSEPPNLKFPYGTEENPVVFARGERMEFIGAWSYMNNDCKMKGKQKIKGLTCNLIDKSNKAIVDPPIEEIENGRKCIIQPRTLELGHYTLILTMNYGDRDFKYNAYLRVVQSNLTAIISNGEFRAIPHVKKISRYLPAQFYDFTLDGKESKDPDNPNTDVGMEYRWFCSHDHPDENTTFCNTRVAPWVSLENSGCFEVSMNGSTAQINTTCFETNAFYTFKLRVSKSNSDGVRSTEVMQQVEVKEGEPPEVTISCVTNCQDRVDAMERYVVKYECNSCYGRKVEAKWTIINSKTLEEMRYDGTAGANLVIPDNFLEGGTEYTFNLTTNYAGATKTSTVQMSKKTSKKPFGGSCEIFPEEGFASITKFIISCKDWLFEDYDDRPTRYEFRYDTGEKSTMEMGSSGSDYPLLNPDSLSRPEVSNVLLPPGLKEENYRIRLKIRIINQYGAFAEWTQSSVIVKNPEPPEDDISSEGNGTSKMVGFLTKLESNKPDNPNDTQAITAYVTSVLSVMHNLPGSTPPTVEPTVDDDTFGGVSVDGVQKKNEQKQKEAERKEKTKFKDNMLDILIKVPVQNIQQLKAVADSLQSVTAEEDEVSEDSQDNAIDLLFNMKDVLRDIGNDKKVGAVYLEQSTKNYVQSISNLFKVETTVKKKHISKDRATEPDHKENKTVVESKRQKEADKSSTNVKKLVDTLDVYFEVISKNKVSGEKASRGKTDSFNFQLKKVSSSDFQNVSMLDDDKPNNNTDEGSNSVSYGFKLPNMTNLFEKYDLIEFEKEINIENVNFKDNIYSWDLNASANIKSEVSSLSIRADKTQIDVSNMTEPIAINIKNKPDKLETRNVSLFMPGDLLFKKTRVADEDCNLLINFDFINDDDNLTQLTIYIQYGKVGSHDDFDVKLEMSKKYGMNMTVGEYAKVPIFDEDNNITSSCNNTSSNDTTTRNVNAHQIDNHTLLLWDLSSFHWANTCDKKTLFFTYSYQGPMPKRRFESNMYTDDLVEYRGAYNYSVRSFCADCAYWNENTSEWLKDGCVIDPEGTSLYTTACLCSHLTSFGGFYVAPNAIKMPTLDMLKHGYVLLVTVGTILLLYVVGLVIARRADKNDLKKIGVCPLIDNNPDDKYLYEITVNTGSRRNAGTKSNVFFNASGDICDSGVHHLTDPGRETFQANSSDVFVMATPNSIGDINYIRIWHDNTGGGWYLRSVEIIDLQTEEKYLFITTRWLAVDKHDGMLDCIIPVCGKEELRDFNYLFTNKSKRELSDAHIWFSIYARPPRSSFTRCQRLSVAISLLFCAMVASCMFFRGAERRPAEEENRIGGFSFRWTQVFVALISACITVPINLVLVGLFRVINPSSATSKIMDSSSVTSLNNAEEPIDPAFTSGSTKLIDNDKTNASNEGKKKKKKAFYLPHWCLYPTWILCILVILGSGVVVILYGMTFGNKKSLDWLASVSICLVQDILLIQPLKVFAMALFIALIVKKLDEEEKSELEKNVKSLTKNESWLHKLKNEASIFDRVEVIEPPDLTVLENMRGVRLKEMKMAAISREMMLYFLFTLIVFMIGYNMRDQNAYNQTNDVKEMFRLSIRNPAATYKSQEVFERLQSYQEFWNWTDVVLLPELYPKKWYNLSQRFKDSEKRKFPGRIYLNDLNSKIVNGVRLRQMRVKHDSCNKAKDVKAFIKIDCADAYSSFNEEKGDFFYNWSIPLRSEYKTPLTPQNKPWRYQDSSELDTFLIMAKLNSYVGGGYVVELFPKFKNKAILNSLKEKQWIDRHTRALIVEFATYNAQTNYFDMIMIVFEFPPSGGLVHFSSVEAFRLAQYTNETAFFVIGCYVLYLLFMIVFTIREMRILYRVGWKYFKDFWNLVELGNILLSLLAIFFYFYLGYLKTKLLSRLPHKVPNVFINFHSASMWYDGLIHIIALICFFVTLKFIKILRFNKRISMLSSTLKVAWYPLAMFGIMFFIIIAAVVFSATIIFGHTLYGYRNWWGTTSAVFSLLLGKFSYYQFESTNIILGPIFFFSFNIMVNWIIMNMFISILNDVFACVQAEILEQENEYEMFDYMMGHIKGWLGFKSKLAETEKSTELFQSKINDNMSGLSETSLQFTEKAKRSGSESSLNKSQHWRAEKLFVDDSKFLMEEDVNEKFVDETVDKFVKCINLLYFNDSNTNKQISTFARSEMKDVI